MDIQSLLDSVNNIQYGWAAAIPAVLSLAQSFMGRKRQISPPRDPAADWINQYGPGMWNKLRGEATNMIDNPYGLTQDIRNRMYSTARNTAEAGYGAAQRGIDRTAALSGLSPAGGSATRQQYYAGQQMAEGLNSAYGAIDIQDYLAKEEQRNRGYNLMFSLSNKSPVYSQIAAQNYWNALNASQESAARFGSMVGGSFSNATQLLMDQYGQGRSGRSTDYGPPGTPSDNYNPYAQFGTTSAPQPPQYNPYDEFGG